MLILTSVDALMDNEKILIASDLYLVNLWPVIRDLARILKLPVLWKKTACLKLLVRSNYERVAGVRARKAREPLRRGVQGPA